MTQTAKMEGSAGELLMAMEIGSKKWKLAFSDGRTAKQRVVTVDAGKQSALEEAIRLSKQKFGLPADAKVVSCYEAGRDGFWIHRMLVCIGIESIVVDSSSILVDRRTRRAKTDRLDVLKLLAMLVRWRRGETGVWRVVVAPSVEQEDARRLNRERDRLVKERGAHQSRVKALLSTCGVGIKDARSVDLESLLKWDGDQLPARLRSELEREQERLLLVDKQLRELEQERLKLLKEAREALVENDRKPMTTVEKAAFLTSLLGVGATSGWDLSHELFWRKFSGRRQVGSATGLTPTPYDSGDGNREQGISKAGNPRLRKLLIEMAWNWLRFQPQSELAHWFQRRFGSGGSRMRRIGIVALARRLVVALWRYVEEGVVPAGAKLKAEAKTAKMAAA